MASITESWSVDWMSDSTDVANVDDQVDAMATAIEEREQNVGRYFPRDSSATSGVLYLSDDAYEANKVVVYDKDASNEPDTADPILEVDSTEVTVGNSGTTSTDLRVYGRAKILKTKTLIVESPTDSENITFMYLRKAVTIERVIAVVKGSATPTVDYNLKHSTDRSSGSPNDLWSSDKTASSTTTGDTETSFDDATVPDASWLWLATSATSGTVNEITVQIEYRED